MYEVEVKIQNFHPCHCVELSDWSYVPIGLSTGTKAVELIKFAWLSAAKLSARDGKCTVAGRPTSFTN